MKRTIGVLAVALLCGAAGKPDASSKIVRFYGAGNDSCAHWLSSPGAREQGKAWMMGFWSGMNAMNSENHMVGTTTDGDAIIGETKLICAKEPSTNLKDAIGRVYYRFQKEGK